MIKGVEFVFDDETFLVPPLSLFSLEGLQARLEALTGGIDKGSIATVTDAAFAAMKRNYPDITRERVGELIDLGNMQEVLEAVLGSAAIKRKTVEALAAADAADSQIAGAGIDG